MQNYERYPPFFILNHYLSPVTKRLLKLCLLFCVFANFLLILLLYFALWGGLLIFCYVICLFVISFLFTVVYCLLVSCFLCITIILFIYFMNSELCIAIYYLTILEPSSLFLLVCCSFHICIP